VNAFESEVHFQIFSSRFEFEFQRILSLQIRIIFYLGPSHRRKIGLLPLLRDILQLIFPKNCPGCDQTLLKGEGAVCLKCLLEIGETHFHECPEDNELYFRLAGKVPLAGAAALFYFDKRGRFKRIIQALKYGNNPQVGQFLGQFYGDKLRDASWICDAEAIIPVPLHRSRFAERGYNQSEMIGKGLSKALGIPMVTDALVRSSKTKTQTKKSQTERWQNVEDAFEVRKVLTGKVILVDDVVTTGATLEACIRELYAQPTPPKAVYVLALGMARHG
jgi:ComF family protein